MMEEEMKGKVREGKRLIRDEREGKIRREGKVMEGKGREDREGKGREGRKE